MSDKCKGCNHSYQFYYGASRNLIIGCTFGIEYKEDCPCPICLVKSNCSQICKQMGTIAFKEGVANDSINI